MSQEADEYVKFRKLAFVAIIMAVIGWFLLSYLSG
jgi:hypothetical protein